MKTIIILAVIVLAVAEPPISKSYLPPPPGGREGYNQGGSSSTFQPGGAPQIIAARTFDQNSGHNGFARSSSQDHTLARFNGNFEHGYEHANPAGRSGLDETSEPANYNFGYMVNDIVEGTDFGHHEERQDESAEGEYHVVLPDGRKQTVSYKADERGFKPQISYEDTEELAGGYDANANNRGNHDNSFHGGIGHHDNGFGSHDNFNGGHGNHGNARSGY